MAHGGSWGIRGVWPLRSYLGDGWFVHQDAHRLCGIRLTFVAGALALVIALVNIPVYLRLTRSAVLPMINAEYVLAARCAGKGDLSILSRHLSAALHLGAQKERLPFLVLLRESEVAPDICALLPRLVKALKRANIDVCHVRSLVAAVHACTTFNAH